MFIALDGTWWTHGYDQTMHGEPQLKVGKQTAELCANVR